MRCAYYESGTCRSCTLLEVPHARQVADKQAALERLVAGAAPAADVDWLAPLVSAEQGFRAKAKMVVGGTVDAPTLGILDDAGRGVDLRGCPLYPAPITDALPVLAEFIARARLEPYDVPARRGELKHVLVTAAPDGALMVRLVLRSTEAHTRIVKHLPWLQERLPALAVASLNILPAHAAVLEGDREIVLTERASLPLDLGEVILHARPRSFLQTNTAIARELYAQVAQWVGESAPRTVWDLYCGVGGFALHCRAPGRTVVGVESSAEAVESARLSAGDDASVAFVADDAFRWARGQEAVADAIVVNPPRRGIGDLAPWLEATDARHVVYSSCNALSLAHDLAAMPSLVPVRGRLLDMFPHTTHYEAVVLLERR
ncbi:23S rRNA (uracil(747)-C(5))-methyltransferase RlmC [Demequina pelophila]|uniref:23S rRNA (uracil(747)-C(5))-methyltransferase RlmC n=1 Tax=Demequina pelophila TaxID=1638984 RepID=UPI000781294B|nr:23S rRNA (uracil(747)-C(5))-methyltransferase RlmC [Demequina pelophila]